MTVEQIYTGCPYTGAYYVESSKGEAIVIDPSLREVQLTIEKYWKKWR